MISPQRLLKTYGPARILGLLRGGGAQRELTKARRSVAVQLYLGLGAAVALTLAASAVGWVTFNQVGDEQSRVNDLNVPDMASAFAVAQRIGALVDTAPRLTVAQSVEEFELVRQEIAREREAFEDRLEAFAERRGQSEGVRRVRVWGREMAGNIEAIEEAEAELLELVEVRRALQDALRAVDTELSYLLITAIDDQFFYAMTGHLQIGAAPAERSLPFLDTEFDRFRQLAALKEGAAIGSQVLANAFSVPNPDLLVPLREQYDAASSLIGRNLPAVGWGRLGPEIVSRFERLFELSVGEDGAFDIRRRELEILSRQSNLLVENREIATDLISEIESLVSGLSSSTLVATRSTSDAVRTGRTLLLVMNVISVLGAVLIGWLFIGRHLVRRLERLSQRMQRMAAGDLESKVEIEGNDEVSDMAAALEVFRKHALEVQRLNLVEKLAEDLSAKNDELESVLADLRKAQSQIVMREKLAALGELTAGVAHEIKNPLNFVKNFSEVSEELLEDLKEILPKPNEAFDPDDQEEVEEICDDLTGNLERIREHGNRADRIVRDMLMMGRGSSERRPVDLNSLVREHVKLAFHSARAADPDFQLHMVSNLDEQLDAREVEVVPQDLGRVVLNMVSNACDATDEKRRSGVRPYMPTLETTTRINGDKVEIIVRDNGLGIPDEIAAKIFNPFFTTKATDKGTGLGLALSNDIVREHGGQIRVDSQPGEFTEMTVELPLSQVPTEAYAA
ncbi:MAG: ATP-binding protein [Bryobacterales bacterium]|nr:ATP-binding protein [Bryobacterales bacterium]